MYGFCTLSCQAICEPLNNIEFMPFHSSVCRETNEKPWCEVANIREVPWYSLTITLPLFVHNGLGVGSKQTIMPSVREMPWSPRQDLWHWKYALSRFTHSILQNLYNVVSSTIYALQMREVGTSEISRSCLKSYDWSPNYESVFQLSVGSFLSQLSCSGVSNGHFKIHLLFLFHMEFPGLSDWLNESIRLKISTSRMR